MHTHTGGATKQTRRRGALLLAEGRKVVLVAVRGLQLGLMRTTTHVALCGAYCFVCATNPLQCRLTDVVWPASVVAGRIRWEALLRMWKRVAQHAPIVDAVVGRAVWCSTRCLALAFLAESRSSM